MMPYPHCIKYTSIWQHRVLLCLLNTALYPVEKIKWCVYVLFIKDRELINTHCLVDSHTWHANLALDCYIWPVSSLATQCIQIHCLKETHLETTVPPLTLISIGNGCKDYSTNIYIPSKSDLTSELDTSMRCGLFVALNPMYHNMAFHGIWYKLKLETLTQEKKDLLSIKLILPQWL